jgi:signal transduction histidine kinase
MTISSVSTLKADVLIVDDTVDNIHLLSTMLSKEGYNVRKAINGQMALMAAKTIPPDLILLDIKMPDLSGYEVCQQLKQISTTAHVPIIFLSALDDAIDKVKAFQAGGVDYITKPYHLEEVLARVKHQLTIRQLQTQLEVRNTELQQALSELKTVQAQLIQKEKMIGLGQLVAGISHEINNPISFITCNLSPARRYIQELVNILDLYQQKYPDPGPDIEAAIQQVDLNFLIPDLEKLMGSIQRGADRIRSVILGLRIFSHLGESDIKTVDLCEGIESVLLLLQHRLESQAERPAIQVIRDYTPLPRVTCHAQQMNQVFLSILTNAIDALDGSHESGAAVSPCADPKIWISTQLVAPNRVAIRIRDSGPGMTNEVRSRIYEPFFTTKPVGQGPGLGLSTSYEIIVEKHRGQLTCNSKLGEGSEFIIEIPVHSTYSEDLRRDIKSP